MAKTTTRLFLFLFFGAGLCGALPSTAAGQTTEWKLRVAVDNAAVRLGPDLKSPVMTTAAMGTVLKSYEAEGAWFRVVIPPGKEEITIIGFIASNEVEILEEKTAPPADFWAPEPGEYRGHGFMVKVGGGLTFFGGGDLADGTRGMYDAFADLVAARGYPISRRKYNPFNLGVQATIDLMVGRGPRLAFGLGFEYIQAQRFDNIGYMIGLTSGTANSVPVLRALIVRPGVYYTLPVSKVISVGLFGGPALFFTRFTYNLNGASPGWEENLTLRASKVIAGAQGGTGLEFAINERMAFILQATGRYAEASGLKGEEEALVTRFGQDVSEPRTEGSLFFVPGNPHSRLTVRSEAPAAEARKASFDFTGVDLSFAIRVKF